MTATEIIEQAKLLPPDQRLDVARQIEDTVADGDIALTVAQRAELDRRLDDIEKNPADGIPWEELKRQLLSMR